jgi:hypothetical protein
LVCFVIVFFCKKVDFFPVRTYSIRQFSNKVHWGENIMLLRTSAKFVGCLLAVWAFSGNALLAAIIGITNGNFETDPAVTSGGDRQNITSWFESATPANGSGYQDWLFRSTLGFAAEGIGSNTTNIAAFSTTTGYIYQQIGTYTPNEQITIAGDALKRAASGSQFTGLRIELLTGNFTGADGTALVATSLGIVNLTAAGLGLPTSGATAASAPFSTVFNSGTSGTTGQPLWIQFSKPNTGGEVYIDNLSAVGAVVPEPSTCALILCGLIGLSLPLRRRFEQR